MLPWLAPDARPWLSARWRVTLYPHACSVGPSGELTPCAKTPAATASRLLCQLQGSGPLASVALWSLSSQPHAR